MLDIVKMMIIDELKNLHSDLKVKEILRLTVVKSFVTMTDPKDISESEFMSRCNKN